MEKNTMNHKENRSSLFSTTQIILLSFLAAVMIGSVLLSLPISTADRNALSYIDALFTATTSVCVTGLVTVPTASTFSLFGQIVILLLIQIGGLGVITILSGITIAAHRKMGIGDRLLIRDAFNLNTMSGLSSFVKNVILGTLLVEGIGALFYMTVFIPAFGARGIWISVFNAVSAFCNAGIDIIGKNSLCDFASNPVVNAVTSTLIILGGLGYIVWWDILRVLREHKEKKLRLFRSLTLHSKIALSTTAVLLLFGTLTFFCFEYNNPETIGRFSFFDKLQVSFFQSVTTRTAGFATVPQDALTDASAIVSLLLMFIGGSPVGTAGGIKTVTFAVLTASMLSSIRNKNTVSLFDRTVTEKTIRKALAVTAMSFLILFVSTVLLSCTTDADFLNVLYETVSATATVGLTRSLTPSLHLFGKIILILTMYLGRVGPISLAIAFSVKKDVPNIITNPSEEISVG